MAQSAQAEALHLAVETTTQSLSVEQENKELRAQLKKNFDLVKSFEVILPRTQQLQQLVQQKKAELAAKQGELISVQSSIISNLKNPLRQSSRSDESLSVIPQVMSEVQKNITGLTDAAVSISYLARAHRLLDLL
jgi:hypothetical protein